MKDITWKTKEGKVLKIKDMETSHINNCIKMLKKNIDKIQDFDMMCVDGDTDMTWNLGLLDLVDYQKTIDVFTNKIKEFKKELERRINEK